MNIKNRVDKIETEVNKGILPNKCLKEKFLQGLEGLPLREKIERMLGIDGSHEKTERPCDICKRQYNKCWRYTEEEIQQQEEEYKKTREEIEALLYNTNNIAT